MENNSEKKKYLKALVGDNVYLSPISLDDVKEEFQSVYIKRELEKRYNL